MDKQEKKLTEALARAFADEHFRLGEETPNSQVLMLPANCAFSPSRAGYCDCETHSMKKREQALAEMLIADGRIAWRKNRRGKHCCWHYRDLRKVPGFALPLAVGWIADESGVIVRKAAREYIHLLEELQDGLDADNWVDSILDIAKKLRQLYGAGRASEIPKG